MGYGKFKRIRVEIETNSNFWISIAVAQKSNARSKRNTKSYTSNYYF